MQVFSCVCSAAWSVVQVVRFVVQVVRLLLQVFSCPWVCVRLVVQLLRFVVQVFRLPWHSASCCETGSRGERAPRPVPIDRVPWGRPGTLDVDDRALQGGARRERGGWGTQPEQRRQDANQDACVCDGPMQAMFSKEYEGRAESAVSSADLWSLRALCRTPPCWCQEDSSLWAQTASQGPGGTSGD